VYIAAIETLLFQYVEKQNRNVSDIAAQSVIRVTSSQPTYDVTKQADDVNSCGQVLSQLTTAMSQLQKDVASLNAASGHNEVRGWFMQLFTS